VNLGGHAKSVDKMTFAQLISCLNDKDKSLIALRLLDDMPYEYIAEKTGDNIINLKTRYHRAIKRLKKIFN
jgi:DNA-directed RNA polymerase specialized sigma24 family protein